MKTIDNQEFEKVKIKGSKETIKCLIGFDEFATADKAAEWLGKGWSVRLIRRHLNGPWDDHGTTNGPIQVTSDLYGDNYRVVGAKDPGEVLITKEGHFYAQTSAQTMHHLNPDGIITAVALAAPEEIFDAAIDNDNDLFADHLTADNAAEIISTNSVVYCYNADTQFIDTDAEIEELINHVKVYGVKELTGSDLDDAYIRLGIPDCFDIPCYATTGACDCVNAIFAIIY